MFGTGPVTHNATFDKHNNFVCKNLVQKGEKVANKFLKWEKVKYEEFESDSVPKKPCQLVTDKGIEITYRVGMDTVFKVDSIICPETSVSVLN